MGRTFKSSLAGRTGAVRLGLLCLLALVVALGVVVGGSSEPSAEHSSPGDLQAGLEYTVRLELENGRLELGRLLGEIAEIVGLDGRVVRDSISFGIDVHSALGRAKIDAIAQLTRGIISITIDTDAVELTVDRLQLRREEKHLRSRLRGLLEGWFPAAAARIAGQYGLWVHVDPTDWGQCVRPNRMNLRIELLTAAGGRVAVAPSDRPAGTVVLVHGLDDPGKVWRSLIPALLAADFAVVRFEYPNDQPITESAEMFAGELANLRKLGVDRLSIVAHSMGGLVSREVLTNPMYATATGGQGAEGRSGDGAVKNSLPTVDRLIMVGTPNHGSQLARLRVAAELRDQLERAFSGDGLLFGSIFDGAGEAKLDLLPQSDFLTSLNARPHPPGTRMTIIAGIASPLTSQEVKVLTSGLQNKSNEELSSSIGDIGQALGHVVDGVGDGLVSLESTRLDGVDDRQVVAGNHLSMIRNLLSIDDSQPPAVPIIMKRLMEDAEKDGRPAE